MSGDGDRDAMGGLPRPALPPVGRCLRCDEPMLAGSLVQKYESSYESVMWRSVDGTLMEKFLRMNRESIVALRCPRCGGVELFSPSPRSVE